MGTIKTPLCVCALMLSGCMGDAHAHAPIAQTGPTMETGDDDAGTSMPAPRVMPEPRACTVRWTEVRTPAPRPSRALTACTDDAQCGVVAAGACCGPCGSLALPVERARAVNTADNPGANVGCNIPHVGCPACAGRYTLEPGYEAVCRAHHCRIVRGVTQEGCPPPVYPRTHPPAGAWPE